MIALPLRVEGQLIGSLHILAAEADAFRRPGNWISSWPPRMTWASASAPCAPAPEPRRPKRPSSAWPISTRSPGCRTECGCATCSLKRLHPRRTTGARLPCCAWRWSASAISTRPSAISDVDTLVREVATRLGAHRRAGRHAGPRGRQRVRSRAAPRRRGARDPVRSEDSGGAVRADRVVRASARRAIEHRHQPLSRARQRSRRADAQGEHRLGSGPAVGRWRFAVQGRARSRVRAAHVADGRSARRHRARRTAAVLSAEAADVLRDACAAQRRWCAGSIRAWA